MARQEQRMSPETADHHHVLDARKIDGGPFDEIVSILEELGADESFLLINSFEPEPLYDVLTERGLTYASEQIGPEEWHVEISQA